MPRAQDRRVLKTKAQLRTALTGLLEKKPLMPSVRRAMDLLEKLIFLEQDEIEKNKGIRIEKFLSVLKE